MIREIKTERLRLAQIQPDDATWEHIEKFALTFDGYKHWGSNKQCAIIANSKRHETLDELRTCLFFEQRRWRHYGLDPSEEAMDYIRSLIVKIGRMVSAREAEEGACAKGQGAPTRAAEFVKAVRLPSFIPILREWIAVLKMYHAIGDEPWRYGERAQVGFLAAKAWRCNCVALEEWRTTKGPSEQPINGRCDLWVKTSARRDYHLEAKHRWSSITQEIETELLHIERAMAEAVNCSEELSCEERIKLAVVFLSAFIPQGTKADLPALLHRWLERVHGLGTDAIAWYIPQRNGLKTLPDSDRGIGSLLLIKKLSSGAR